MLDMREPSENEKLQAPSIPEIKDGLITETVRLARLVKFRGRKLRPGPLINAVLLHFLKMPAEERARIAQVGVAAYEALLGHDDLQTIETDGDASSGTQTQRRSIKGLGGTVLPRMKRKDKASEPNHRPGDVFGLR